MCSRQQSHTVKSFTWMMLYLFLCATFNSYSKEIYASESVSKSFGQVVYAPIYSHIYHGVVHPRRKNKLNLSANLSVRNADMENTIELISVDYYDTDGNLVKRYLDGPKTLMPLASDFFFISTFDTTGGWGANFIVKWKSAKPVNSPIIESLMSGSSGTHAYSFVSPGRVIESLDQD